MSDITRLFMFAVRGRANEVDMIEPRFDGLIGPMQRVRVRPTVAMVSQLAHDLNTNAEGAAYYLQRALAARGDDRLYDAWTKGPLSEGAVRQADGGRQAAPDRPDPAHRDDRKAFGRSASQFRLSAEARHYLRASVKARADRQEPLGAGVKSAELVACVDLVCDAVEMAMKELARHATAQSADAKGGDQ